MASPTPSTALNAQLPPITTSEADLDNHASDAASESSSSSDTTFYDCRSYQCESISGDGEIDQANPEDVNKSCMESHSVETILSSTPVTTLYPTILDSPGPSPGNVDKYCVESPGAEHTSTVTPVTSPEPALLDSSGSSLGRTRGHPFSTSIAHTGLEAGASLEQIAAEGPLHTLEEVRDLEAQERERVKKIRSDSIAFIRERTRIRQNSLNLREAARSASLHSTLHSPGESLPSAPSITLTDESGVDMAPKDWGDSALAAEKIRVNLAARAAEGSSSSETHPSVPLAPRGFIPATSAPLTPHDYTPAGPSTFTPYGFTQNAPNMSTPLGSYANAPNMLNPLAFHPPAAPTMPYCSISYEEQVAMYARMLNENCRTFPRFPRSPMTPTPFTSAYTNQTLPTVAEALEPPTAPSAPQAPKEQFTMSPRTLSNELEESTKLEKKRTYRRSKSCDPKVAKFSMKWDADPTVPVLNADDDDLSDQEDPDPKNPPTTTEPHQYTPWAQNIGWFYVTKDKAFNDRSMRGGLIAVIRPKLNEPASTRLRKFPGSTMDTRVDFDSAPTHRRRPKYSYDAPHDRFLVRATRDFSFDDVRNDLGHPDHMPVDRLLKYQAFEFAGFDVWRHDRQTFHCAWPDCTKKDVIIDHQVATQICPGCGPKSWLRYCCKEHLLRDVPDHWQECGTDRMLVKSVVDEQTQPARFYRRLPMIEDRGEFKSWERHDQGLLAIRNVGQYTMCPEGTLNWIVTWPQRWQAVMVPRVERLLNIAFHDRACRDVISYLYRLLRYCLVIRGQYHVANACLLWTQFHAEFGYRAPSCEWMEDKPCECEWTGKHIPNDPSGWCHRDCVYALYQMHGVGEVRRGTPLKEVVDGLESKRWILRIWRRRMGMQGWKRRLRGEGFEGKITENVKFIEGNMWKSWCNVW